jgi:hypothetical protein
MHWFSKSPTTEAAGKGCLRVGLHSTCKAYVKFSVRALFATYWCNVLQCYNKVSPS